MLGRWGPPFSEAVKGLGGRAEDCHKMGPLRVWSSYKGFWVQL